MFYVAFLCAYFAIMNFVNEFMMSEIWMQVECEWVWVELSAIFSKIFHIHNAYKWWAQAYDQHGGLSYNVYARGFQSSWPC